MKLTAFSMALAAAILMVAQVGLAQQATDSAPARNSAGKFVQVKVKNPAFSPNELFQAYENYYSPRIKLLREKYKLDDVVKNETDEWQRMMLLRHWIATQIPIENINPPPTKDDAFAILDSAIGGQGGYHCGHFSLVQHAVLNSFGYVTRRLGCGPGQRDRDGFHGTNEVWVNKFSKWVVIDAKYDKHFEKDGMPLSALEIRDELIKDGGKSIRDCYGMDKKPTTDKFKDENYGYTADTYLWINWETSTNSFTNVPNFRPSTQVLFEDEFFRKNIWQRNGKQNWIIGSPYAIVTANRGWIEWTPNVIESKVRIVGEKADISLSSFTPNFRSYQIKTDKGWEDCREDLALPLVKPANTFLLRTVNLFGVTGPEHKVQIDWQE